MDTDLYIEHFLHLEERARVAKNLAELRFSMANETFALVPYRHAFIWQVDNRQTTLATVSGLAQLGPTSSLQQWLERLGRWLAQRDAIDGHYIEAKDLPAKLAAEWSEWLPQWLVCFTVSSRDGRRVAIVGLALDVPVPEAARPWLARLPAVWGHAWTALDRPRYRRAAVPPGWRRHARWAVPLLVLLVMAIPVRTSVLAPAEVAPLTAFAIAAPMDGVVHTVHVKPNQHVKRGDRLLTLDDTSLRARREVVARQLAVSRADALTSAQRSFENNSSRGDLAILNGRVAEREAELAAIDQQLARIHVVAPSDGVVVFADALDWQGKPVVTGERIALLADPAQAGLLIWLPVADAIALGEGSAVRFFMRIAPTAPLNAQIVQSSYQASLSPEGIAAYKVRARFVGVSPADAEKVRVGLAGTAKVYGASAPFIYYVLRRPLAALREWTGW